MEATIPRTGATYNLPVSSWYPSVAGTVLSPDDSNATLLDLATALTGSLARSGAGGMQANLLLNGYKITSVGDGSDDADAANVGQTQAISANGTAFAALSFSANTYMYATAAATFAVGTITADGRSLIGSENYAAMRTALGLVIGTNVQAWDAQLDLWAAITPGTSAAKDTATAAEFRANTADKVLETDTTWAAAAVVTLTDAASITCDMSTFINAQVTLGGNRGLLSPTNPKVGQSGFIEIIQDGGGNRTLAFGSNWKFAGGVAPVLSTAAGTRDVLFYSVLAVDRVYATLVNAVA